MFGNRNKRMVGSLTGERNDSPQPRMITEISVRSPTWAGFLSQSDAVIRRVLQFLMQARSNVVMSKSGDKIAILFKAWLFKVEGAIANLFSTSIGPYMVHLTTKKTLLKVDELKFLKDCSLQHSSTMKAPAFLASSWHQIRGGLVSVCAATSIYDFRASLLVRLE